MKPIIVFSSISIVFCAHWAIAQSSQSNAEQNAYECTQLSIDKVDESLLTKAERLALMDRNLQVSMDQYEQCVSNVQQQMAGASGGSGQGGQGTQGENAGEGSNDSNANNSEASAAQDQDNNAEQTTSSQQTSTSQQSLQNTSTTNRPRGVVKPKDNDSIICQLLWQEIQDAPPEKVDGFTKQYKDYKCG